LRFDHGILLADVLEDSEDVHMAVDLPDTPKLIEISLDDEEPREEDLKDDLVEDPRIQQP